MIMTKRLDTGSPWPLNNGGLGKYAAQDGALRLTQMIAPPHGRPTYFARRAIAKFTPTTARSWTAPSLTSRHPVQ